MFEFMNCSRFHHFSRLPCELRRLIWEGAIRPIDRGHGIQSVSIVDSRTLPEVHNQNRQPNLGSGGSCAIVVVATEHDERFKANRSAYLWDTGLWAACRESRIVIEKWFNSMPSDDKLRYEVSLCLQRYSYRPREPWIAMADARTMHLAPSMPDSGHECQLVMRSSYDGFKLDLEKLLSRHEGCWRLHLPELLLESFPFSTGALKPRPITRLVVEFDSRWNDRWPRKLSSLRQEATPRAFIANMVFEIAAGGLDTTIWLIDQEDHDDDEASQGTSQAIWEGAQGRAKPLKFYDCDEQYMEAKPGSGSFDLTSAFRFIEQLHNSTMLEPPFLYWRNEGAYRARPVDFWAHVHVLYPTVQDRFLLKR